MKSEEWKYRWMPLFFTLPSTLVRGVAKPSSIPQPPLTREEGRMKSEEWKYRWLLLFFTLHSSLYPRERGSKTKCTPGPLLQKRKR